MMRVLAPALALLPAVGLLVPTASYAADDFEPTASDDPALVTAAQAWDALDVDDYTTRVRLSCFCPRSASIKTFVRDGEVRKVTQGGKRIARSAGFSMDELYLMIREGHETADRTEVTYTPRGVPKSITIDPKKEAVDEERYYAVSVVQP